MREGECGTSGVGFRGPSPQEVAVDLGDLTSLFLCVATFYSVLCNIQAMLQRLHINSIYSLQQLCGDYLLILPFYR